jgi:hypothetical protein
LKYFFPYTPNSSDTTQLSFNATTTTMSSIMISDVMERHIMSFCSEYVGVVVRKLAVKYNFDADEAIAGLELPTLKRGGEAVPKRKEAAAEKPKKEPRVVPAIPLPFCGVVNDAWCHAIVKNNKLFTQCTNSRTEQDDYCKKCSKADEKPFGDIESRTKCGLMEFKDPKGTLVVPYSVVMKKLNITRETAEAEAAKFGWTIDEQQFLAPEEKPRGRPKKLNSSDDEDADSEKKAGKRGRPKKEKPVKASSQVGDDIIAGLLAQAKDNKDEAEAEQPSEESSQGQGMEAAPEAPAVAAVAAPKPKKATKSDEDKAAAKAAKEAEKEAAKAAKEAEKEAAKAVAKAAKEAEKAAKEAEKAAAKAAKEAQKTKATIAKAEAATKVKKPVAAATAVPAPVAAAAVAGVEETKGEEKELEQESASDESEEESEEEPQITVKKFEHEGKKYKLSSDNILYDWNNDEPVGVWNPKTKTIDELPSDEEDEDEE